MNQVLSRFSALVVSVFLLSACGVETASTAAATAAAKAEEAKAGKQLEDKMKLQIEQATQQSTDQLKAAEQATQ